MNIKLTATVFASALAAIALTACNAAQDQQHANAFPMGQPDRFDQPVPSKPLFSDPIVAADSVLPQAKVEERPALPELVALASAENIEAAPSNTGDPKEDGAVNPAAGQAAAITDGQGEGGKHELGASK